MIASLPNGGEGGFDTGKGYVQGGNGDSGDPAGSGGKGNDGIVNTTPSGNYEAPGGSPGTT
ncbi:hypothetical protein [Kitasatospora sp. NPDC005751]|uniref:hypothetical protein n=1 Tax=Kitasatospora sp. NPDC005751 TaxID=3157064 RepID=UPI0033C2A917